jgi:hypothetical protein
LVFVGPKAVPFPLPTSVVTFGDQLSRQSV